MARAATSIEDDRQRAITQAQPSNLFVLPAGMREVSHSRRTSHSASAHRRRFALLAALAGSGGGGLWTAPGFSRSQPLARADPLSAAPAHVQGRALGVRVQRTAGEAIKAKRREVFLAAVGNVLRGQAAHRQSLEAVARVDDRVDVIEHPVADRIVVRGVGHDAARRCQLPVVGPTAEARQCRGQPGGEEIAKGRPTPCSGLSVP